MPISLADNNPDDKGPDREIFSDQSAAMPATWGVAVPKVTNAALRKKFSFSVKITLCLCFIGGGVLLALVVWVIICLAPHDPWFSDGDPGGKRLNELSSDSLFSLLPVGVVMRNTTRMPAQYQQPNYFKGEGGWEGPKIIIVFTSSAAPSDIFGFYDRRAMSAGWHPTNKWKLGFKDSWTKTYPDGAVASINLLLLPFLKIAGEPTYQLFGSTASGH